MNTLNFRARQDQQDQAEEEQEDQQQDRSHPHKDSQFSHDLREARETLSQQARKTRKPYTITKQRENWTEEEHQKFLEALKLYDRDWKKIENYVATKTVIQIRSHAQKHFLKIQKSGTGERIPPPRPKRKSTQPYPHKPKQQSENATIPWNTQSDPMTLPIFNNPAVFANWMTNDIGRSPNFSVAHATELHRQQQEHLQQAQSYLQQAMAVAQQNQRIGNVQGPNFSKIYGFLGSLFDPSTTNHVEALNEMSPIDRETVQLLMHNLAMNLANQQFREQHTVLLEHYRYLTKQQPLNGTGGGASLPSSVVTNPLAGLLPPSQLLDNMTSINSILNQQLNNFTSIASSHLSQATSTSHEESALSSCLTTHNGRNQNSDNDENDEDEENDEDDDDDKDDDGDEDNENENENDDKQGNENNEDENTEDRIQENGNQYGGGGTYKNRNYIDTRKEIQQQVYPHSKSTRGGRFSNPKFLALLPSHQ